MDRGDEALDVLGHVRLAEAMEVGDHRAEPLVEGVLETLDLAAVIDAALSPRAVGALERELPARLGVLAPGDRLHEIRAALRADVELADLRRLEANHFDRATARQIDPTDRVLLVLL